LEQKNPRQALENIYNDRDKIYSSIADYTVDTSKSNISALIIQIINFAKITMYKN
jgi:shikimate kinase